MSAITTDFSERGFHVFPDGVDPLAGQELLKDIRTCRDFGQGLFLTEAEFEADPQYRGTNPRPGRNLLESFEDRLAFVETNPGIVSALGELLGPGYVCMDRKIVCGVPRQWLPAWVWARIEGKAVNNLGPYIRPEYRDITYFAGIDFHQDLIDYRDRPADFVTVYVYLHAVGPADAPLFLLEGSHSQGGTLFPHALTAFGPGRWLYGQGDAADVVTQHLLTGPAGYAAVWHACTLHGTQPDAADHERLSLRYLFARDPDATVVGLDRVNAGLKGPLRLTETRRDLDPDGSARPVGNIVNGVPTV
ncbi:hypothetical protein [Brevundimonas sp.]|uniref:hypothetical protein n=1 Tax=Brevundimonas sp. TaxID=1871086 RepID=UPI002ABB965E|nr:hypothetical protein [Brevundimonas sp.]MDZ4363934.1 hypothetical protein [Brevundimonas sp.]